MRRAILSILRGRPGGGTPVVEAEPDPEPEPEPGEPTEVTIYSDGTYDDTLETTDTVAATVLAAAEAGSAYADNTSGYVGWYLFGGTDYYCNLLFVAVDTSSIPDGATITSVTFQAALSGAGSGATGADIQLRISPSRAGQPAVTDWLDPTEFAACTLVATTPYSETPGLVSFTSEAGFPAAINKTGITYFVLGTAEWAAGNATTDDGFSQFLLGGQALEADRPRLVIEYE